MATQYRLGDADRERLGTPEWIPLNLLDCTLDDVTFLSDRFGFELEEWPDAFVGKVDAEGNRKRPKWRLRAGLWLALHQAGLDVSWDVIGSIAIMRVQSRVEDEPGKESGSADEPPPPTPESSTTPPSSTSSPD